MFLKQKFYIYIIKLFLFNFYIYFLLFTILITFLK